MGHKYNDKDGGIDVALKNILAQLSLQAQLQAQSQAQNDTDTDTDTISNVGNPSLNNIGNPVINLNVAVSTGVSGTSTSTFSNFTTIDIPTAQTAIPYPSLINVSGLVGIVTKATVTLHALNSLRPEEYDILLVGPQGQNVYLMASAGGDAVVINQTVTFDDSAATMIPNAGPLVTGTFQPSVYPPTITFPAPAPTPPYSTLLNAFNGTNPNGTWRLFIVDDIDQISSGNVAGGWTLTLTVA
ncbi:hypothetical protein EHS13_35500 [Paenibacillus psychroresistens]|uniref:P/Homo B domain-containing protein n=1 Tax=Paenibacillus psychroresistens TaxID=1778678 RepID=A0A6B8RVW6_9BACL|nr:hypothetical protein [Paenibacillus psychroresistens]QGQ99795.1 hypothetical protein EHS13_35500 [Paenibacillus psychroresistens]